MHLLRLAVALLLAASLSGCVINVGNKESHSDWQAVQDANKAYIRSLELGTSIATVEVDLGEPDFRDRFRRGNTSYTVLFYRTHHRDSDGDTTRDETTPLVFSDGQLVGWGASALELAD